MKSKAFTIAVIAAVLVATGAALGRVTAPVWSAVRQREPALQLDPAAAGQGATLALLGGFRALVADGAWIRMYTLWERRDLPGTQTLIHFVTTIDPRPIFFWLNGVRITAYDFPVWRIEEGGGFDRVSPAEQQRIGAEQGKQALQQLDAAMKFHPQSPDLWIERANVELNRFHDLGAAAECYRRAWEQPHGPYYAARLYAELLRKSGRKKEALDWLIKLYPQLPSGDEAARADVVLERIRDLERELHIPPDDAFKPQR